MTKHSDIKIENYRKTEHRINPLILKRWSPRAMSGEKITREEIMTLFEAARWAPSSYNNQPWRFVYALRDTEHWNKLFDLMIDFNKSWTKNAWALVVIISKNNFEHNNNPSITHSFDTGAAWENMALQASDMGLVIHGMEGFDYDKTKKVLGIPEDYTIEAMCAVGKPGNKENLPEDIAKMEVPSGRKDLSEFVFDGEFKA